MSFNRQSWDKCTYDTKLHQSVDSATYQINTPRPDCIACYPNSLNQGQTGIPFSKKCNSVPLVDIDSELRLKYKTLNKCSSTHHFPTDSPLTCAALKDCELIPTETTRLSNPPCTLRGTGWNRWAWLCQNPQDNYQIPFLTNINSRQIVKDNHRPCVQKPAPTVPIFPGSEQPSTYSECVWDNVPKFATC